MHSAPQYVGSSVISEEILWVQKCLSEFPGWQDTYIRSVGKVRHWIVSNQYFEVSITYSHCIFLKLVLSFIDRRASGHSLVLMIFSDSTLVCPGSLRIQDYVDPRLMLCARAFLRKSLRTSQITHHLLMLLPQLQLHLNQCH